MNNQGSIIMLWCYLPGHSWYFSPTCSTRLPPSRSARFSTPITCLSTCSTRLSTRSTRLSTRSICLSTRSTRSTICGSFYNWSFLHNSVELVNSLLFINMSFYIRWEQNYISWWHIFQCLYSKKTRKDKKIVF